MAVSYVWTDSFFFPDIYNSVTKQKVDSFSTFKLYHKVNAGLLQKQDTEVEGG